MTPSSFHSLSALTSPSLVFSLSSLLPGVLSHLTSLNTYILFYMKMHASKMFYKCKKKKNKTAKSSSLTRVGEIRSEDALQMVDQQGQPFLLTNQMIEPFKHVSAVFNTSQSVGGVSFKKGHNAAPRPRKQRLCSNR